MQQFIRLVEENIARHHLLKDGAKVLVAVSGGVDSMVLLHVLHELALRHRWSLVVAHFDHQLRGRAAAADLRFVERVARKLGLRFVADTADVQQFATAHKLSVEMAARKLRHEFLARTARALGLPQIALAHHADDQTELFFLRLLRGAGSEGLGGMKWQSGSPVDKAIALVRPLLGEPKSALLEFARARKISFREDATNRSPAMLRNRLRHELLPLLRRRYQPGLDAVTLRTMELLRDEADFITQEAQRWRKAARTKAKLFESIPVAVQRRVLQLELLQIGIAGDFDLIESLRLKPGEWTSVSAGCHCRRLPNGRLETRAVGAVSFSSGETQVSLGAKAGSVGFDGVQLQWAFTRRTKLPAKTDGLELFDAAAVGQNIIMRHWRAGDRFQPIGLAHAVKLQDWFVNQKVPRAQRHKLMVATTAGGEIFWVEGQRIGDCAKVTPRTTKVLRWVWSRR